MTASVDSGLVPTSPFTAAYEGAKIIRFEQQRWGGVGVQVKEQRFSEAFCADLQSDHARFSVVLDLAGGQPEARESRGRPTIFEGGTIHQMNFAPGDCPIWAYSRDTKYFRTLSLFFRDEDVEFLQGEHINPDMLLKPRLMFFDHSLLHIARLLEIECRSKEAPDSLYLETLTLAFLLCLARFDESLKSAPLRGGLTPYQLRQVTEYLSEHLAEGASLEELATLTGLSRSYFSRAFRKSTGMPAHEWLLHKRILKSKEHLLSEDFSIAEIAHTLGFSDQAHFSRTFSRIVGASPATWRRARAH